MELSGSARSGVTLLCTVCTHFFVHLLVVLACDANNDDLKLLGTDGEPKDNGLFEELMDVLKPRQHNEEMYKKVSTNSVQQSDATSR